MKNNRQIVKIVRQQVRTEVFQNQRDNLAKLQQFGRKEALLGSGKCQLLMGVEAAVQLPENRADPDVSILQVRRGVALEGKHLAP